MAKLSLGEGDIFMFCGLDAAGRRRGSWHTPARTGGQRPLDGFYMANCRVRIPESRIRTLRLPFTIGLDMPPIAAICRDCKV